MFQEIYAPLEKTAQEKCCRRKTSRIRVNNMWTLENFTNLLSSLAHFGVRKETSIQTFDCFPVHSHPTLCMQASY